MLTTNENITIETDIRFMRRALLLAKEAYSEDEVPIGAIIVNNKNGQIISEGYNQIEKLKDATAHAEIIAITSAENHLENWRLSDCSLYVTIEPCMMCSGAIALSRLSRIIYGAKDSRMGFLESRYNIKDDYHLYKDIEIVGGILEEECSTIMKKFFKKIREKDNK